MKALKRGRSIQDDPAEFKYKRTTDDDLGSENRELWRVEQQFFTTSSIQRKSEIMITSRHAVWLYFRPQSNNATQSCVPVRNGGAVQLDT